MQQAFQEYLKRVKAVFPTFERFNKGDEDFSKSERNYKLEIIELFNKDIQTGLSSLPSDEDVQAELGRKIINLFTRKLSDGKPQNLVGWRYFEFIHNLDRAKQAQFAQLTASLLYGAEELSNRIDQFVSGLGQLSGKDQTNWAAMSRSVTSFLLMLSNPQDHVIIKTNEFRHAFQAFLNQKIPNRNLTGKDYLEIQNFLYALRNEMIESGLAPRDLIDVQSFIWVGDQDYNKENQMSDDMDTNEKAIEIPSQQPKNQILYGAAGTGKTYHTINKALEIIAPQFLAENINNRKALKDRFDQLMKMKQIRFVTFHQSFSYEDFVEGIRAKNNEKGELYYETTGGVFKEICDDAIGKVISSIDQEINLSGKNFWKMSLGDAKTEKHVYNYCIENSALLLGWGHNLDYSECKDYDQIVTKMTQNGLSDYLDKYPGAAGFVDRFKNKIKIGDLVVISEGNFRFRAIGEVTSEYERYTADDSVAGYVQKRSVKWLKVFQPSFPIDQLFKKNLSQPTVYNLSTDTIDIDKLRQLLKPESAQQSNEKLDFVLIIDEINRGNISRIFGELITLIEESKRAGQAEALSVTLPYSKEEFSVPDNVYIIGTMNSSDRSLTGLDIALRRRFTFIEMQPKPEELAGIEISSGGIMLSVQKLLEVMNQRIEILLDRDHCLGHAYFMPFKDKYKQTVPELAQIFQQKIMPLLQEYFYDDWERIDWILNCNGMVTQQFKDNEIEKLFPKSAHGKLQNQCWKVNSDAFNDILNYQNIIGVAQ